MAIGLGLAGLGALAKGISGIIQGGRANRIIRENPRPFQTVQNEYFQNVNDAEQMARTGLPQEQYNLALQNQQRNQTGVLRALGRSANPSAGLAGLLRASNDATMNLDARNAEARQMNRRYLAGQRGILAGQKKEAFDWNQKSRYLAKMAEAQALRGAGAQNLMGAFGDVQQIGAMVDANENGEESQQPNYNLMPSRFSPRAGNYSGSSFLSGYYPR